MITLYVFVILVTVITRDLLQSICHIMSLGQEKFIAVPLCTMFFICSVAWILFGLTRVDTCILLKGAVCCLLTSFMLVCVVMSYGEDV